MNKENEYINDNSEVEEFIALATPLMDYLNKKFGTAAFQYEILITEDSAKVLQTYLGHLQIAMSNICLLDK